MTLVRGHHSVDSVHLNIVLSAGQDATEMFYSLHRNEVLHKPQYQRLIIGQLEGEESTIYDRIVGEISTIPYGEPTWLSKGYHSPYYTEVIWCVVIIYGHQADC